MDELAVNNFREYLRIPSVHPNVNYDPCVLFLKKQAEGLVLPLRVYYCYPKKPIVIITWTGTKPSLPSILLNGHMDVVPVYKENWTYDPFGAEMDEEGNIYARGAQDMKCVSIQYLEAIRRLKQKNVVFSRTIHVSFVPDEEIGSYQGMRAFANSKDFKDLNVGFALDEGMPSSNDEFGVVYGEKFARQMYIHCPGKTGHGSLLLSDTAGEKVRVILDRFIDFRNDQKKKLEDDPSLTIGDVPSVNVTQLEGGVQINVVPPELIVAVDSRLPPKIDLEEFENTINQWCKEAGEDVWIEYPQKDSPVPVTELNDSNMFWVAFKKAADELGIKLVPEILSGGTDNRFLRPLGIPALGFSPMNHTITRAHAHDEYLNKDVFLRGIEIYDKLISAVANLDE